MRYLTTIGRLKPGLTVQGAQAEMVGIMAELTRLVNHACLVGCACGVGHLGLQREEPRGARRLSSFGRVRKLVL
jgi:hypothetical protein